MGTTGTAADGGGVAEFRSFPEPERVEELGTPALEGLPPSGTWGSADLSADPGGAYAVDEIADEGDENRAPGVPAPGMSLVGEDARRFLAGEAEEAPDEDDQSLWRVGEAEELAAVEAVADDAEGCLLYTSPSPRDRG